MPTLVQESKDKCEKIHHFRKLIMFHINLMSLR